MALKFPVEEYKQATADAFADPQPGDIFEEFLSFWVQVLHRDGDTVQWREGDRHAIESQTGKRFGGTVAEFGAKFAYGTIPGYSVKLCRRRT